jgi:hypothetical protein
MILSSIFDHLYSWTILYISFSVFGLAIFSRITKNKFGESNNELVINTLNISGVLFSLFITFVVVTVWNNWEKMDAQIATEANAISNMYSQTHHLPESKRAPLRLAIKEYTNSLITDEWPAMAHDKPSEKTQDAFMRLRVEIHGLYKLPGDNKYFYSCIYPIYIQLSDLRRTRIHRTLSYLPAMVWYILFTGSFVTIIISFFYRSQNIVIQYIMNFFVALMFSMGMFICYDLNNPFRGESKISNKPFQILIDDQFKISDTEVN